MVKKIISFFILIFLLINNSLVFSLNDLNENYLYYFDTDNNWKIDKLEIEFNKNLTWNLNFDKIFFYSNTWWLSTSKLDSVIWTNLISNYYLSWNILWIDLIQQDNYLTGLTINNTTSSHLRLKTNVWIWITDVDWNEIKFLYTTSFDSYKNVSYKENILPENEQTWTWETLPEIIEDVNVETNSWEILEEENIETSTWETQDNSSSWNLLEDENINSQNTFSHQIKLLFQSPSYLLEKDQTWVILYNCDTSKTDCKVNLNLNIDEWTWFESISTSKYECIWDFGFSGETDDEKNKCNPNTVTYPLGEFETNYKIIEKSNTWNYFTWSLMIKNEWFKETSIPTKIVYVWWWSSTIVYNSIENPINIETPEIVIQSWLDENKNCKKENCSINLNYEIRNSKEACLWDFPGWVFDFWTNKKCNPWYVKYPLWDFKVTLRVYEIWKEYNFKESNLYFTNKTPSPLVSTSEQPSPLAPLPEVEGNNTEEIPKNYTLKISKVSPNPTWSDNLEFIEIQNFWSWEIDLSWCSLDDEIWNGSKAYNFWESVSLKENESKKFYKFDTKLNINNSWNEEVNLICNWILVDNLKWNFSVSEWFILSNDLDLNEIKKIKKQKDKNIYEITYKNSEEKTLSFDESFDVIDDLMKKDLSKEEKKQKLYDLVEKSFYQKVSKQKSWVKVYWTTIPNTKIIIKLEKLNEEFSFIELISPRTFAWNNTFETKSDKNWSYEIYLKNPDIWEFELKTFLNFWENNLIELPKKSSLEIDNDYLEYISSARNSKNVEKDYETPKSIIILQWKLTKNKTFSNNKLVCIDVDECSINLDWSGSKWKKIKYYWDFWNGKIFTKKNPTSYKFWVWVHMISLTVSDNENKDTSFFIVEVKSKELKNKKVSKNLLVQKANASFEETQTNNNIKIHIIYSSLLFLMFLLLSFLILKNKNIL